MKASKLRVTFATLTLALGLSITTASQAQEADKLPNHVPVLPQIKARALAVDPQKGYLVKPVEPDVHVITDGIHQSAFVTTGKGVIPFDAPECFARHIVKAVAEVTREPILQLVCSHAHLDHIAGAVRLAKQVPKLTIVAEAGTAAFLRDEKDARRPLPTGNFKNQRPLKPGTMTIELKKGRSARSRDAGSTSWPAWTCPVPAIAVPHGSTPVGTTDRHGIVAASKPAVQS